MSRLGAALRVQANRVLVGLGLLLGLPVIVVAEKLRRGSGRRIALRMVRAGSRAVGLGVDVIGTGQVPTGRAAVLVANHSSPLDIPVLMSAFPEVTFVAAADLYRVPLLGAAMRALGTVAVDRRRPREGRRALTELAISGAPPLLAIFPEGGIPPKGDRKRFKTGAFALAIESGAVVVPVAIHHTADLLPPRGRLGIRPGWARVEGLDIIETTGVGADARRAIRDQAELSILDALGHSRPDLQRA